MKNCYLLVKKIEYVDNKFILVLKLKIFFNTVPHLFKSRNVLSDLYL